jgi:hypothetical protein
MGDYKACETVIIQGKKRVLYSKKGTAKKYLLYKGRMMNVVKYKKMLKNKNK